MIEVHLIGYTADLRHVVLDVDPDEERGRYRLVVDGDLFATLDDLRHQRWEQGLDVGEWDPSSEDESADAEHEEDPAEAVEYVDEDLEYVEEDLEYVEEDPEYIDEDEELEYEEVGDEEAPEPVVVPAQPAAAEVDGDDASTEDDLLADLTSPEPDHPLVTELEARPAVEQPSAPLWEGRDEIPGVVVLHGHVPSPAAPEEPAEQDHWSGDEDLEAADDGQMVEEYEEYEDEVAVAPVVATLEASASEQPQDLGHEWESSADVAISQPLAPARDHAGSSPRPTRALDSDLPAALPSSKRTRTTAEGLPIPADSRLSPAEIQAELRKGRSVRLVARDAGTDEAWVSRWLEPIQAEQARIIKQAMRMTVVGKTGPPSALPLEEAVAIRLRKRGVNPAKASWDAVRRDDGTWRISCRFQEKGRSRTASWLWMRGQQDLRTASELAREVGWVDRRLAARSR